MTAFALCAGSLFPIVHLGRAWRFFWMIPYSNSRHLWPNFQSPLMWDAMAITTYLLGSLTFLYVGMIPDLAIARDHADGTGGRDVSHAGAGVPGGTGTSGCGSQAIRSWRSSSSRWPSRSTRSSDGTSRWRRSPGGTARSSPPTSSPARSSPGIAALLIAMVIIRKFFHLETAICCRCISTNLSSKLLLLMSLLWFYFPFAGYFVTWYGKLGRRKCRSSGPRSPANSPRSSGRWWCCNFLIRSDLALSG